MDNPAPYRQYLLQMLHQHPELFPEAMDQGFTLRPSLVMPSIIARTEEVAKALSLRQWGVPFDALASVFGRDAMFWYRAWLACGRPALLGTTVKDLA